MDDLLFRPVAELAQMVRGGELTATELVTTCLDRIEALDPTINAFTYVARDEALAEAAHIGPGDSRPFAGVPIAIKDNRAVAGMPLTMGSDLFGDFRPRHDTFFVRRLRAAGFVIVGKTAMPENGILPTCESRRNGPTKNPWALDRTPGGSSGGSAAAVAAGMVPIAHGNDGGGSTRIPLAADGDGVEARHHFAPGRDLHGRAGPGVRGAARFDRWRRPADQRSVQRPHADQDRRCLGDLRGLRPGPEAPLRRLLTLRSAPEWEASGRARRIFHG
jgi:hypothetical protein